LRRQPADSLPDHYARRALVFPSEEDFEIVIAEAMAAGKPVIAYGRGEALDSVVDGSTGIFFGSQTVEAIVSAIARLEAIEDRFEPARIAITGTQGHESTLEPPKKLDFVSVVTMDGPSLTTGNLMIFGSP
jgi:glycosyltransferase involved in cell wall biosynthesis